MHALFVSIPLILLLVLPAAAQQVGGKTKSPPAPTISRTYVESIDMSSGQAVATGAVILTTLPICNGDWRVERIVWAASDPLARPWGFD